MNLAHAFEARALSPKAATTRANWLGQLWNRYWEWRTRLATVAVLSGLDDRTLKDLGLHRGEIGSLVYGTRRERPFR